MKFEEAIETLKQGRKVKFNDSIFYMEDGWIVKDYNGTMMKILSIPNLDNDLWYVVEDKKTLSDKGKYSDAFGGARIYNEEDVKTSLKELFDVRFDGMSYNEWKERTKRIFGEDLIR